MAQQNLGVTIVVSLLCGLLGGIVGGLLAPAILGGVILGAAAAVTEEIQEDDDKRKRSVADMRTIGTACEAYAIDNARYPNADSVVSLAVRLEPTYVRKVPYKDGWGNRFLIASSDRVYEIRSAGADGAPHTMDDIVYSNGDFTQYP